MKTVAKIHFEISCFQGDVTQKRGITRTSEKLRINYFFMRNMCMKFQNRSTASKLSVHSRVAHARYTQSEATHYLAKLAQGIFSQLETSLNSRNPRIFAITSRWFLDQYKMRITLAKSSHFFQYFQVGFSTKLRNEIISACVHVTSA